MYVCAVVLLLDFYCFPFVLVLRMVCITNVWGYMEVFPNNEIYLEAAMQR